MPAIIGKKPYTEIKRFAMETTAQTIPESLVYEMTDQGPIYYRGYEAYLDGIQTIE